MYTKLSIYFVNKKKKKRNYLNFLTLIFRPIILDIFYISFYSREPFFIYQLED